MEWTLEEALSYYKTQGAPQDQTTLVNLLREIQANCSGCIPLYALHAVAAFYGIKESFLQAIVKRIPSLRLGDTHELILCAGPNCSKHKALADYAEKLQKSVGGRLTVKFGPCMRMCGKGPNVKLDGKLYHGADEALLRKLTETL